MCQCIVQKRDDSHFDLEMHYCQYPEPSRYMRIEHIGTHMTDRDEAVRRAQAKYAHHDCAKRFNCNLTWAEREPKAIKKEEPSYFDIAIKHQS